MRNFEYMTKIVTQKMHKQSIFMIYDKIVDEILFTHPLKQRH